MSIWKKVLISLSILIASLIFILGLLLVVSPKPAVKLFSRAFDLPVRITNKSMYEANAPFAKPIVSVKYGSTKDETADIYQPKANLNNKVIIWVRGGGFIAGDKKGLKEFGTDIVAKTHATVMSINYTVAPEAKYPTQVEQLAHAVAYLKANAHRFNLDADKLSIIIGGDSSGAQIAAQYAALVTNPKYAKEIPTVAPVKDVKLAGTILYCGPYDFALIAKESKQQGIMMRWFVHTVGWAMTGKFFWHDSTLVSQASIPDQITKNYPPTYVTDGNYFSFPSSGKLLVKQLEQHQVPVTSRFFDKKEKVNHEYQFDLATKRARITFNQTVDFVNAIK